MERLEQLSIKIFADGADFDMIVKLAANPIIRGFTTNPTIQSSSRLAFVSDFVARLLDVSRVCSPYPFSPTDSPFFYPVLVDGGAISCGKIEFAEAVRAEGIDLNPHYRFVVSDWPYIRPYLADGFDVPNAHAIVDRSFNLYLNERPLSGSTR